MKNTKNSSIQLIDNPVKQWQQNLLNSSLTYTAAPQQQFPVNITLQAQSGTSPQFIDPSMGPPQPIPEHEIPIHFSKRGFGVHQL